MNTRLSQLNCIIITIIIVVIASRDRSSVVPAYLKPYLVGTQTATRVSSVRAQQARGFEPHNGRVHELGRGGGNKKNQREPKVRPEHRSKL